MITAHPGPILLTTTSPRTDIHRPSAAEFNPEDYEFTGAVHDAGPDANNHHFREVRNALLDQGYTFSGVHGGTGQCDHCGALLRYSALMIHKPTRTLLYVGERCLDNRFESMAKAEFQEARRAAKLDRARQACLQGFRELCERNSALVYATYAENIQAAAPETYSTWTIDTLVDIARKARTYGEATDRQLALLDKIFDQIMPQQEARLAEQKTNPGAWIGTLRERREFTATVRRIVGFDSPWGWKTLVTLDTPVGTLLWSTTSPIEMTEGEQLSFKATVKAHREYRGERQTEISRPVFHS